MSAQRNIIPLTRLDGSKVLINMDFIIRVEPEENGVRLWSSQMHHYIAVREDLDHIMLLLAKEDGWR